LVATIVENILNIKTCRRENPVETSCTSHILEGFYIIGFYNIYIGLIGLYFKDVIVTK